VHPERIKELFVGITPVEATTGSYKLHSPAKFSIKNGYGTTEYTEHTEMKTQAKAKGNRLLNERNTELHRCFRRSSTPATTTLARSEADSSSEAR